jgi:RNA polymerase sigma-70 factor (ECF subfamily)
MNDLRADVDAAVAATYRLEWTRILSTVIHVTRDFDTAEDCTQDAFAQALVSWPQDGIPDRPGAWLTTVAVRQALQRRRRAATLARKLPLLVTDDLVDPVGTFPGEGPSAFDHLPDDRLRLVFTCCHPALAPEARTALTLRLVCGLSTVEVAAAFLVRETAMQARITRAKKKIAASGIPYRTPRSDELPRRLPSVLDTVHLLYSTGQVAHTGGALVRADIAERSIAIARMLHELVPDHAETAALLALLLLTDARRPARSTTDGALVLLRDQDRSRWDHDAIATGLELLRAATGAGPLGRYAVMAAIAAVHASSPSWDDTDWSRIMRLYDLLLGRWPSPVTALNRAIAVAERDGPAAGLSALDSLGADPGLATYHYLPAARAELLDRLGRPAEAAVAFREALALAVNPVEVRHLAHRLGEVEAAQP